MNQHPNDEPRLTPAFVIAALRLDNPVPAAGNAPFTDVSTDSRKIRRGCLFVALAGEKFDGHDFAAQALAQGASAVICRRGFDLGATPEAAQVFRVDDTLGAFRTLAAKWREAFSIPVAIVAGSNGKTTTKELLAAILSGRFTSVLKTTGSQNGFVGIPMTLLELRPTHGAAVIEVGIDEIGAMEKHLSVVRGTVAIVTSISHEHLDKLRDLATIAREEGEALLRTAQAGGYSVINLDDPWIEPYWVKLPSDAKKTGYTLGRGHAGSASSRDSADSGSEILAGTISPSGIELEVRGSRNFPVARFPLPLPGEHNAANCLGAIAIAASLGLGPDEIAKGLASFRGASGRSELRTLSGDTRVVCDYYNANPSSMLAGIQILNGIVARSAKPRSRWVCLADMLELGPDEENFHRGLAPTIVTAGIEHVLLYGKRMLALADELRKQGYNGKLAHFETQQALAQRLAADAKPGDAILIKGSHSMQMEKVWAHLEQARANP